MHMETDPTLIASFLFWLRKLLTTLALPPFGPLAVLLLGMLCLRWRRTPGRLLIATGLVLSVAFTSPLTVGWMLRPLEATPPLALDTPPDADAIIILGGGKQRFAPEYDDEALNHSSLERARYGAHVARHTDLPVLVTGGRLNGTHSEAELLREALENDWNIPVRWSEDAARNTRENARLSARILQPEGVSRVVLVTHAVHMPRARREFEAAGFTVVPAPTAWLGAHCADLDDLANLRIFPTAGAAHAGFQVVREALALLVQSVSLRPDARATSP